MRNAFRKLVLMSSLLMAGAAALYAQANSSVTGIVTDQTGAVIAGAKVVLIDTATGVTKDTVSGSTGLFMLPGLNPSTYNVKVTAKGFESYAQNGVVVNVSSTVRDDIKLNIGAESETITVSADALTVQTDSNVVSTLVSSEQITSIATENRNFAALASIGLGVTSAVPDSNTPTSVASSFTLSVNGLRFSHNIWLIDGGESDDRGGAGGMSSMPSQDAIAEFNMLTSNYPPDYGISSGATISMSLKSGQRDFHGSLWEFNRNTVYNANNYFNKMSTTPTPRVPTHYNIYGGNIGGPLFIPHFYNTAKAKTFFFWNEEWRKVSNSNGTNQQPTIPTANIPEKNKDLVWTAPAYADSDHKVLKVPGVSTTSEYYLTKLAPLGLVPGQAFPNSTIPASLLDNNAITYLRSGILPAVNTSNDYNTTSRALPINVRDDIVRIDHNFNSKWAILGHYLHDDVVQGYAQPELGWLWASYNTLTSNLKNPSDSAAIKLTGTINPELLVEASINYDGNVIDITPSANTYYDKSAWTVNPVVTAYQISRLIYPSIEFGAPMGTAEHTGSEPFHNAARDYQPKVDVSYTSGKHAMKFGFSYNRFTKNQMLFGESQGTYTFGGQYTTKDGTMDMLLGLAKNYSQLQSSPMRHYVNQTPSVYAMDNWHVTPRLSFQYGFRFDAMPHAWERQNLVSNFNPAHYIESDAPTFMASGALSSSSPDLITYKGLQVYANGEDLAGAVGIPRGLVTNDYNTFQPRIGFSEDIFGNGRTVLRGGIGTFYERMQGNDIYDTAAVGPYSPSLSLDSVYFSDPGHNYNTGAAVTSDQLIFPADGLKSMTTTYKAPAVAQFSFGVQHEVAPSVVLVVQYVGNLAWHQNIQRHINNMKAGGVGLISPDGMGITTASDGLDSRCVRGAGNTYDPDGTGKYAGCSIGFKNNGGFNAYRPYKGYGVIDQIENSTNSNYSGFQTGLRIQNRWGLSGEIDYTWSHEIDLTYTDKTDASNPWNLKYDKGSGNLDRRHVLNMNYIYNLPFFNKSGSLVHSVAGGWQLSGTVQMVSGSPAAGNAQGPQFSADYDPVGLGGNYTNRPNISGKVKYIKKGVNWFDTSNFSVPTPVWAGGSNMGFGNAGKDSVVGPHRVNFTTSLYKSFAVTKSAHFELRLESFNTFNHTEFKSLNDTKGSGKFGQITSTWDPRNLELAGKFVF